MCALSVKDLSKKLHLYIFLKNKQIHTFEHYVIFKSAIITPRPKCVKKKSGAIFEKIAFERF